MVLVGFLVTHWIAHTHAEPSRLYTIQYTVYFCSGVYRNTVISVSCDFRPLIVFEPTLGLANLSNFVHGCPTKFCFA